MIALQSKHCIGAMWHGGNSKRRHVDGHSPPRRSMRKFCGDLFKRLQLIWHPKNTDFVRSIMRQLAAVLVALSIATASSVVAQTNVVSPVLSPEGPLPIALKEAPALFKQCSRIVPVREGEFWLPTREQIDVLEDNLPKYLETVQFSSLGTQTRTRSYRGQHVGFVRAGTRYIYASYYDAEFVKRFPKLLDGKVLIICDGGSSSWGIVYNPTTGKFTELELNGYM